MSLVPVHVQKALQDAAADLTNEGPVTRLELLHCQDGDPAGELVHREYLGETGSTNLANEEFHQYFWDKAEQDAKTRTDGVSQRYVILFFRGSSDNTDYDSRFPFVIRVKGTALERASDNSTPPNEIGITGQMLRHDVDKDRLLMLMAGAHAERCEGIIDRQAKELRELYDRQHRIVLLNEELLDRKSERQIREAKELQRAKRVDDILGMVTSVLPIMLAELRGPGGGTGLAIQAKLRDQAVGNLLKQLTPEQLIELVNKLPIDAQIPFWELYKSYRNDANAENAKKPEVFQDKPPDDKPGTH